MKKDDPQIIIIIINNNKIIITIGDVTAETRQTRRQPQFTHPANGLHFQTGHPIECCMLLRKLCRKHCSHKQGLFLVGRFQVKLTRPKRPNYNLWYGLKIWQLCVNYIV